MLKSFNTELDALIAKYSTQDEGGASQAEFDTHVSQATCEKVKQNVKKVFEEDMS